MNKHRLYFIHFFFLMSCIISIDLAHSIIFYPTPYIDYNKIRDIAIEGDYVWCACTGGVVKWDIKSRSYEIYTMKDGLIWNLVTSVAVDHNGVKWFGSQSDGVVSFDDTEWNVYHDFSGRTLVDHNNVKWFAGCPLYSFDDEIRKVHRPGCMGSIFAVAEDLNHVLWFAGYSFPLTSYDGTTFTYHSSYYGTQDWYLVYDIAIDSSNTKWLASLGLLYSFNEGSITEYNIREVKNADGVTARATTIDIDKYDVKWFGASDYLWSFDGESYNSYKLPEPASIGKIRCEDDGTVWVATSTGLCSFNGDSWERYYVEGPGRFRRWSLAIDHNDMHWYICTGSVARFDIYYGNGREAMQMPDLGDQISYFYNIFCTTVDIDNTKWFGTNYGVLRYDGENAEWFTTKDGLIDKKVFAIATGDNGMMWFGTNHGVSCFDGTDWNTYTEEEGLVSNLVRTITVDQDNVVWFGTPAGISCFDGNSWTAYTEGSNLVSRFVYASAVDRNNVKWFGTRYGVSNFDDIIWKSYTEEDGLVYNRINEIAVDHNNIKWFATDKGISCFDGTRWRTFTEQNGLPTNMVHSVAVDTNNIVWLLTNNGEVYIENYEVGVQSVEVLPQTITIISNYPNPFNISTTIEFNIPESGLTTLQIYNIQGHKVRELVFDNLSAGKHSITWNGRNESGSLVSSGIYISRIKQGEHVATGRMVLMK